VGQKTLVSVGARSIALTNLDKVFWPDDGLAKGDLVRYFADIAPFMLPYLANRPLVFTRYPDGISGEAFYQKEIPKPAPEWVRTYPVFHKDAGRVVNYVLAEDAATLVWLANLACLEIHPWLSSILSLDNPDFAAFDLDPADGATFSDVKVIAGLVRQVLESFGLQGFVKTTGATGLHIFVPVRPAWTYDEVKSAVEFVARMVVAAYPDKATVERRVSSRTGKVYIDYLQNIKGKTLISIFSPRPRPGAPVSFPVTWSDLDGLDPGQFTIRTAPDMVRERGDPFAACVRLQQDLLPLLSAAMRGPAQFH
jgi:bifunctional non-homologous end joining protein LigD